MNVFGNGAQRGGGEEYGVIFLKFISYFLRFRLPFLLNLRESKINNSTGFNGKQNQLEEDKVI